MRHENIFIAADSGFAPVPDVRPIKYIPAKFIPGICIAASGEAGMGIPGIGFCGAVCTLDGVLVCANALHAPSVSTIANLSVFHIRMIAFLAHEPFADIALFYSIKTSA